ncbi:MAG: hypothetical protein KAS32_21695 [Candidatus Peribacteraceae bacterium]|nr:hypothetical protein [Candidatus Peribacteraceae bacterium]
MSTEFKKTIGKIKGVPKEISKDEIWTTFKAERKMNLKEFLIDVVGLDFLDSEEE